MVRPQHAPLVIDTTSGFEARARVENGCRGRRVPLDRRLPRKQYASGRYHQDRRACQNARETTVKVPHLNLLSKEEMSKAGTAVTNTAGNATRFLRSMSLSFRDLSFGRDMMDGAPDGYSTYFIPGVTRWV